MKSRLLLLLLIAVCVFISSKGQESFSIQIVPSSLTSAPAVHSGSFGIRNSKWIFIGGRTDGMHVMQSNQAFPEYDRNDSIFVVDPVADTYKAVSLSPLPVFMYGALCSANMQFFQDGQFLYMVGGYGYEDSSQAWITFPSLISIDLDCLIQAVDMSSAITGCFRQIIDSNMAVTGGALDKIDSTYHLVFGHRFDGRYARPPSPLFTQTYTHEIRKFTIQDNGISFSINNYSVISDTDVFHRRDFNLVPQIYPNLEKGFTVFGGVFQKQADLPFLTPIDITSGNILHQLSFNENLNQYTTATLPIYDSANNYMHTVFFGGLSQYTLDSNLNLVQDTLIPFVSTISMVTRNPLGILQEIKLYEEMPALLGANAMFIPDATVPVIDGRIISLNDLSGVSRAGYIAGGIHSDAPNVADIDPVGMSRPNSQLYEVYILKTINSVGEINLTNQVNNLYAFPNPAGKNLQIRFSINKENSCEISLFGKKGNLIAVLFDGKVTGGDQNFNFPLNELADGSYFCKVEVGNSVKLISIIVQNNTVH